jgi:hypothetical protein
MKIFRKILVSILLLALLLILVGFLLPSKWKVERSIVINAPVVSIYPLVANFKSGWPQWSSFDFEDPAIQYRYSGPDEGVGAARSWTSKKMGDGSQEIIKADPASGVEFQLHMEKTDFVLHGQLSFEPSGNSTKVTWHDDGEAGYNPMYRYMGALMNQMMGPTFEKSLAALKQKAEMKAVQPEPVSQPARK